MVMLISAGPFENLQRRKTRSAPHRIAGQRADLRHEAIRRCPATVEAIHDVLPSCDGGDGEPAADGLTESAHVRRHVVVRLRTAISHPKSCHDLIEDQQDVVVRRQASDVG